MKDEGQGTAFTMISEWVVGILRIMDNSRLSGINAQDAREFQ